MMMSFFCSILTPTAFALSVFAKRSKLWLSTSVIVSVIVFALSFSSKLISASGARIGASFTGFIVTVTFAVASFSPSVIV